MATEEKEKPYEGGAGGKFRKRPFRRTQTTPYDRPPTSLRNPSRNNNNNNNGWLSKVASNSSGKQQGAVGESDVQISCSDGVRLSELEKLLRQMTFTRSEIDHLTALMHSRTVDAPVREDVKQTEVVPSEPMLLFEQKKEEYPKTPALENGIENRLALTPCVTSRVPIEDVASPVELAKAYMWSRPSKVSSSVLGMRSPALREDPTLLESDNLPLKSPASGFATPTHTQSVPFGSSASSPSFGLTGNTAFPSRSTLFPSSSSATTTAFSSGSTLFPSSSSATNVFNSGTTFGLSTFSSSSAASSASSNSGTNSTLFGSSSWQPSKSPFSSAFSSSSSGFSFGTSTASVASTSSTTMFSSSTSASSPQFSFTSAAATTSTQPAFGSPNPGFTFGSAPVNNDHMSMEDSMAEDSVQATPPATPIFGQPPAPVQSNFVFGASTPSGASPFQFASQQNFATQNPSSFQASGSLEFIAGGSFSLGSGGVDKSGRKFVRVKHKQRRK